jgi:hypothetical protein
MKGWSVPQIPGFGQRLYETFSDFLTQFKNLAMQTTGNPTGQPQPPPVINAVNVTGANGHFNVAITDNNTSLYRGVSYFVEHSADSQFSDPQVIHIGTSRNHTVFLGNVTRFWRAYSAYPSSPPSAPSYHGGNASPQPVTGGGTIGGPSFQPSQGSGTGAAGVGLQGPGTIPYRTATGAPPIR